MFMYNNNNNNNKPMKIYIRIYSLTLKFIIPWTYHGEEVVETPFSEH